MYSRYNLWQQQQEVGWLSGCGNNNRLQTDMTVIVWVVSVWLLADVDVWPEGDIPASFQSAKSSQYHWGMWISAGSSVWPVCDWGREHAGGVRSWWTPHRADDVWWCWRRGPTDRRRWTEVSVRCGRQSGGRSGPRQARGCDGVVQRSAGKRASSRCQTLCHLTLFLIRHLV